MANIDNYDWYSLIQISGAFISPKVFKEAFPQGLNWVDSHSRRALRNDYEDALDEIDRNPAEHKRIRRQWCESVFREFLGYDEGVMDLAAPPIPLSKEEGENRDFVLKSIETTDKFRPDYIIHKPGEPENVRYFVAIADNKDLNQSDNRRWPVTPLEQMTQLCRLYKVEIGMVTNGSQWALVYAPIDTTSSTIVWDANMWFQEPDTLRAFHTFWCVQTCCDEDRWPEKLIRASSEYNDNVTTQLGAQVRRAVEVLIQCLDKEDRNREGRLLNDIDPGTLYQAGLTVMMRLVFILCAEERGLLMLGDAVYDQFYAISTLRGQLEDDASKYGEDVLERRYDAWARMLAVFRAIYHGVEHENLRMPALGGSIFDPDAYPFLEGRAAGSKWLDGDDADPLPIDNHTVLLLLDALQILQHKDGARRLSYRALDVEQIGHVYEGLLEHTVERAKDVILGFEYTKGKDIHPDIALTELESARFDGEEKVKMLISECTGKKITDAAWKKKFLVPDDDLSRQIVRICGSDDKMAKRILPYAGFLRKNAWGEPIIYHKGAYMVTSGSFRSDTGTYYTPKKLTELVVKDALEPVVYIGPAEGKPREEWQLKTPAELLSLSICDPAMGSGAFLVQVCRYLGERICEGWELAIEAGKAVTVDGEVLDELGDREPLPKSADERLTIARRLVAKHCIYGVDINPMAVELAKLSIWLVTMSKNKPFGYLDHCFKCGDSLLGIHSIEQLRHCAMNPDVTEPIQKVLFHKDISQNIEEVTKLQQEIRQTRVLDIQDVEAIRRKNDLSQRTMANLKLLADAFVAEAFRCADKPKTVKKALEAVMCLGSDIFNEKSLGHMPAVEQAKRIANVGVSIDANRPRKPMHWLLEFPQVMMHGGFDVIVGNPPYGVDMSKREMAYHKNHLKCLEKGFDIYMCFYVYGLQLTKSTLSYVTPDKWLSKAFGKSFRECFMKQNMTTIYHMGNDVFKNALVDIVVSVFNKLCNNNITIYTKGSNGIICEMNKIDRNTLSDPFMIDQYFRKQFFIVSELERLKNTVSDYAWCEYGMVGPTAYQLKEILYESEHHQSSDTLKVVTTGLIDKFDNKWHEKSMKYLGVKYSHPMVKKSDLLKKFGETFCDRVSSPKIIIKGINLLDCCLDVDGAYMSTVATLNIRSSNKHLLIIIAALLNSSIVIQYIKSKYFTGGYCGGTLFTPDMINRIPIPPINVNDLSSWYDVIQGVNKYLNAPSKELLIEIDNLVLKHYQKCDLDIEKMNRERYEAELGGNKR